MTDIDSTQPATFGAHQSASSSSTSLEAKLEAFYARRRAGMAAVDGVAPVVEKSMNQDRPIIKVMVEDVVSGKSKDGGDPYCTLSVVVQPDMLANYADDRVIKNFVGAKVGTVDLANKTMTLHTNEMKTFKASLDYWASKKIAVKEQSPVVEHIVIRPGMSMSLKVDKAIISSVEHLEPFSVISVGLSCTAYCTTEEQAGKKANPEPIKGTSLSIKQIDLLESANAPKVTEYIIANNKCQVPLPTAKALGDEARYEHRIVDDKKKQKIRSATKFYLPLNYSPVKFFGGGKGLLVSLSTKQEEGKSPFSYGEKDNKDVQHKKAELFLTIEEVDPQNEQWLGAKHVITVMLFESMLKVFRINSVQRWKEIAPVFFAKMQMIVVGAANLYTTFENPRTKNNMRDDIWFENYLDVMPQQLVVDFPAEVARIGIPVSRRWVEQRLADGKLKQGDHFNQLGGSDKSVLNLTEFDSAAALAFLRRPSSAGYEFFVVTDTVPTDGHLEMYENVRSYMKTNPGAPGLEMLLWPKFSTRNAPLWIAEMYGASPTQPVEIGPDHACLGQPPLAFKSSIVYAIDVGEVVKRQAEAKQKPIAIAGAAPVLAIAGADAAAKSPAKQTGEKRSLASVNNNSDDGNDDDGDYTAEYGTRAGAHDDDDGSYEEDASKRSKTH